MRREVVHRTLYFGLFSDPRRQIPFIRAYASKLAHVFVFVNDNPQMRTIGRCHSGRSLLDAAEDRPA